MFEINEVLSGKGTTKISYYIYYGTIEIKRCLMIIVHCKLPTGLKHVDLWMPFTYKRKCKLFQQLGTSLQMSGYTKSDFHTPDANLYDQHAWCNHSMTWSGNPGLANVASDHAGIRV